jgi:hypothetical protein
VPNGDYNHTPGDPRDPRDVTEHSSLKRAKDAFWRYCEDPHEMADETTTWNVYFYDPTSEDVHGDPYPDRQLSMGPRGGVRVEHY